MDAITGITTTVAGNGIAGFSGDGGPATNASLDLPFGIIVDGDGNLYIADVNNHCVRRVDAITGLMTTVAGNGITGFSGDGGPAIDANLFFPWDVAVDNAGNVYIAERNNARIRKVDTNRIITTVAGGGNEIIDGVLATNAILGIPLGVTVDAASNIYISDVQRRLIRRVDANSGIITTAAGVNANGPSGDGGPATSAVLYNPNGMTFDTMGNMYFVDRGRHRIRRIALLVPPTNNPPLADAGVDQTLECTLLTGTQVTLDGSASSDEDDLTYTWTGPFPEGNGTVTGVNHEYMAKRFA